MCTERKSLTKECGWKDGDRGGLAQWQQTHGKKKVKVCLDINRPSHGRSYRRSDKLRRYADWKPKTCSKARTTKVNWKSSEHRTWLRSV